MKTYSKEIFTRYYTSNKKANKTLHFKLEFQVILFDMPNREHDIEVTVFISYLLLLDDGTYSIPTRQSNTWKLVSNFSNKSCSLESSIMIREECRSFGIGSFVLNEVLSMANIYLPNYSLKGTLATNDEFLENTERRNNLYRNIGFKIEENNFSIDTLSNLNLDRTFDYIKLLDDYSIINTLIDFHKINEKLKEQNKNYKAENDYYQAENDKLLKKSAQYFLPFIVLVIFNLWYFIS